MTTQTELLREALEILEQMNEARCLPDIRGQIAMARTRLSDALAQPEQPAPQKWLSIETAPKDGTTFLGFKNGRIAEAYLVPRDDCEMWSFGNTSGAVEFWPNLKPTHWMPLPAPPMASPPQAEQAEAAKPKNVPFQVDTWELDADGFAPTLCTECGTPVRYGSRHSKCGQKLMKAEAADHSGCVVHGSAHPCEECADLLHSEAAKPETERAWLLGTLRGIATIIQMGEPERLKVNDYEPILQAAALLSADSKDAGEPVAGYVDAHELKMLQKGALEPTISRDPVSEHDVPLYTRPQAADAQPLTVRLTSFPESNGKRNWTALLIRKKPWDGLRGNAGGVTLAHGEMWNRVAYEAERARFLIGERDTEPYIMDYGVDIKTPNEWAGERAHGITGKDNAS